MYYKKIQKKNLRKFILKITNKPLSSQGTLLDIIFEKWKGDNNQIDDVIVFGFKY